MKFGRNQQIGLGIGGLGYLTTVLLVVFGKVTGAEFLSWQTIYIPWWVGLILVPGALVKGAAALKGPTNPPQAPSL